MLEEVNMTRKTSHLSNWFVTDDNRIKAQIKNELKHLDCIFNKCMEEFLSDYHSSPDELNALCDSIIHKYLYYLNLLGGHLNDQTLSNVLPITLTQWPHHQTMLTQLKDQLFKSLPFEEERDVIVKIISVYYQCKKSLYPELTTGIDLSETNDALTYLKEILQTTEVESCLSALVDCWNQRSLGTVELSVFFRNWSNVELEEAIKLSIHEDWIDLINAIFFYKLYPEKLFDELIHPEKLVSVTTRLSILHQFVELLHHELNNAANQHGLTPGIDYFFHGDELPQGIMIDVKTKDRELIQNAIKRLRVTFTLENEALVTLDILHDIGRAYKFWFNPNRLIDAVMVLQQRLVKYKVSVEEDLRAFKLEMVKLYHQLTTTECMDLYGYFANDDSRFLIYSLHTILEKKSLDWLPALTENQSNAILQVYQALNCVMEALRDELKCRHVSTEPYAYDLSAIYTRAGRRNREAVFRIIAVYGTEPPKISDHLEKLFNTIEDA